MADASLSDFSEAVKELAKAQRDTNDTLGTIGQKLGEEFKNLGQSIINPFISAFSQIPGFSQFLNIGKMLGKSILDKFKENREMKLLRQQLGLNKEQFKYLQKQKKIQDAQNKHLGALENAAESLLGLSAEEVKNLRQRGAGSAIEREDKIKQNRKDKKQHNLLKQIAENTKQTVEGGEEEAESSNQGLISTVVQTGLLARIAASLGARGLLVGSMLRMSGMLGGIGRGLTGAFKLLMRLPLMLIALIGSLFSGGILATAGGAILGVVKKMGPVLKFVGKRLLGPIGIAWGIYDLLNFLLGDSTAGATEGDAAAAGGGQRDIATQQLQEQESGETSEGSNLDTEWEKLVDATFPYGLTKEEANKRIQAARKDGENVTGYGELLEGDPAGKSRYWLDRTTAHRRKSYSDLAKEIAIEKSITENEHERSLQKLEDARRPFLGRLLGDDTNEKMLQELEKQKRLEESAARHGKNLADRILSERERRIKFRRKEGIDAHLIGGTPVDEPLSEYHDALRLQEAERLREVENKAKQSDLESSLQSNNTIIDNSSTASNLFSAGFGPLRTGDTLDIGNLVEVHYA